jgi:hypothetical protein
MIAANQYTPSSERTAGPDLLQVARASLEWSPAAQALLQMSITDLPRLFKVTPTDCRYPGIS